MPSSPKMPPGYLTYLVADAPVGDRLLLASSALVIDLDGDGWIDPRAMIVNSGDEQIARWRAAGGQDLLVERADGGFKVDFGNAPRRTGWVRVPKPVSNDGLEWIPVIEYIYPDPPQKAG